MASLGPNYSSGGATNSLGWAHCISSYCRRQLHLGPIISLQMLPMTLNGPIAFAAAAADGLARAQLVSAGTSNAIGLARYISSSCCQWCRLGLIIFREVLQMPWDRPIAFSAAAADGIARAQLVFCRCSQCPWICPITLAAVAADSIA